MFSNYLSFTLSKVSTTITEISRSKGMNIPSQLASIKLMVLYCPSSYPLSSKKKWMNSQTKITKNKK